MNLKLRSFFLAFLAITAMLFVPGNVSAQVNPPLKIAVVAPLYIDSAFDGNTYKLGNTSMPRYILPGLDFYNGVMMAVDSLKSEGIKLDVWVFDTKKKNKPTEALIHEMAAQHFSLIIASFSNLAEQKAFSDFSFSANIPLISATYPNDAYVSGNPFFIMLNSTLRTHIDGYYKYLQRTYPVADFLYVTRKGTMEDRLLAMYNDAGKKTYPIKFKTVELPDNFSYDQILPLLDSNRQNVIICGSLDETFGSNLITAFEDSCTFPVVLAGAPTWDGMRTVVRSQNPNISIVYSTPFNYPRTNPVLTSLINEYRQQFFARASDMVFKGFENMYSFSHLLVKYNNGIINNLTDNSFLITNAYNLQPVKLNASSQIPDYLENKKLYFITRKQGKVVSVNSF